MPLLITSTLLTGCSGRSCDELPGLQAEREAARQAQVERTKPGSGVPVEQQGEGDDALHELEGRVFQLEQECSGRD